MPHSNLLIRSRPRWSVPKKASVVKGVLNLFLVSITSGSGRGNRGVTRATNMTAVMTTKPARDKRLRDNDFKNPIMF